MRKNMKIAESAARVKAFLLDVFFGFFLPSVLIQVLFSVSFRDQETANFLSGMIILLTMLIYWIFIPVFGNGQTFGKLMLHLKIVDLSGKHLKVGQLVKRNLAYVITAINSVKRGKLVLDENGLLDHDRVCNTTVVNIHE